MAMIELYKPLIVMHDI